MHHRYLAAVLMTSLALAPASAATKVRKPERLQKPPAATYSVDGLYSARALRRAKLLLQFRLLELRKARLDRVRTIVETHGGIEDLLRLP